MYVYSNNDILFQGSTAISKYRARGKEGCFLRSRLGYSKKIHIPVLAGQGGAAAEAGPDTTAVAEALAVGAVAAVVPGESCTGQ